VVTDANGIVVGRVNGTLKKGFQQVSWDLTTPFKTTLSNEKEQENSRISRTAMVDPGTYTVTLYKSVDGSITQLGDPQTFEVERIRKNILSNPNADKFASFKSELLAFSSKVDVEQHQFKKAMTKVKTFDKALQYVNKAPGSLENEVAKLRKTMNSLNIALFGSSSKAEVGEKEDPTVRDRVSIAEKGFFGNSYGPTKMHMESFELAKQQYASLQPELQQFILDTERVEKLLQDAGAPPIVD